MSFDRIVEAIIKEAMERGEFDDLPGKGKPIDLTEYFETPEDVRMANSVLKNAGYDLTRSGSAQGNRGVETGSDGGARREEKTGN